MGVKRLYLIVLVALLATLVACAPKATPVPPKAPTPVAAPAPTAVAPQPSPIVSPEDTAWQAVVAAAKREGTLTIYGYWSADTNLRLQQWFKEKYGINLEFIVGRGAEQLERLMTERRMGKMLGDVFVTGVAAVIQAQRNGLTTSLAELPVLRENDVWLLPPDTYSPDKQILCVNYQAQTSAVNTQLLSPADVPRSYKDLITPAWKGRMIATSPVLQTGLYSVFVPLLNRGIIDIDFMKALGKQDLSFQVSFDAAFQGLARGERPFSIHAVDSTMTVYIAQGAPIKPVVMEEGTAVALNPGMAVIKGAPHTNAAKLFANWLMSREGQDVYAQAQSYHSIRKDVADYTPKDAQFTAKKLINTTPDDQDQIIKMFNDKFLPKLWEK